MANGDHSKTDDSLQHFFDLDCIVFLVLTMRLKVQQS